MSFFALFLLACGSGSLESTATAPTVQGGQPLAEGAACDPAKDTCRTGLSCCAACCAGTVDPRCVPVAPGDTCDLPDLTIEEQRIPSSVDIHEVWFEADNCAVLEGCVEQPGWRRVLRFELATVNQGPADLRFGDPYDNPGFIFSECHQHTHFDNYAAYSLQTVKGDIAAAGHKQAFCLRDSERVDPQAPSQFEQYDCLNQGISVGWADTYGSHLDCQWVDITGVAAGDYLLHLEVNTAGAIPEVSLADNVVQVPVSIVAPADEPPVTEPCVNPSWGAFRNCGWERAGSFACDPGAQLAVGCEGACDGKCKGNPILRVCPGDGNDCRGTDALAWNDYGCDTGACPEAQTTCPKAGYVTALLAPQASEMAASCNVVMTVLP